MTTHLPDCLLGDQTGLFLVVVLFVMVGLSVLRERLPGRRRSQAPKVERSACR